MSKRPNPVKGKTVVHQDPNLVFTREATLLNKVHGLYERFAIIIYNKWNKDPSFVEWVPYGNSSMQSKARVLARNEYLHAIVKTLSKGE